MRLENIHNIYFVGIGGIGMSALARYFKSRGKLVAGYDKTPSSLTNELELEGINVHFNDDITLIPANFKSSNTIVIYTPAIPKDHKEYNHFLQSGYVVMKRSEALGLITKERYTIAVAGTHGKTTTSSMITHLLKSSGVNCTAFLGGISKNYETNFLSGEDNLKLPVVVEADEYDRSFLTLHPDLAVITSLDADHLDIYGAKENMISSYAEFSSQLKANGVLVISTKAVNELGTFNSVITYSLSPTSDYYASDIKITNGNYSFDVNYPAGVIKDVKLGLPGLHNVENSIAAVAIAHYSGLNDDQIKNGLSTYSGVKRRFEYRVHENGVVFIDDYAHHPEELKACILSVKQMFPGKTITGIFQPHLFSRTRDFADEFSESLSLLDEVILLDIYPARELPIEGVTSEMLLSKISIDNKMLCAKADLVKELNNRNVEVLLTLGAGDIDRLVEPLEKALREKYLKTVQ